MSTDEKPGLIPPGLHERFPGGEWLDPVGDGISTVLGLLERAKHVLLLVAGAVVLLYVGAKVERALMKRPEPAGEPDGDRR